MSAPAFVLEELDPPQLDHRPPPMPSAEPSPLARVAPFLVGTVTLIVAVLCIMPWPVGVFQDDGIYVILAKSLAEGHGYRYLNLPGQPLATHYPPGYPALLALLWKLSPSFPDNVALFKFVNAALLAVSAVGAYHFARVRLRLSAFSASFGTLAATASVPALILTGILLSEPLFLALLFPTLLLCERAVDDGRPRDALLAGALAGVLTLVRTLGIAVIPALLLALVLRRRWKSALLVAAGAGLLLAPWQLWVAANEGAIPAVLIGKYGSYTAWFVDALREHGLPLATAVVERNTLGTAGLFWILFSAPHVLLARIACLVLLFALFTLGFRRHLALAPVSSGFFAVYMVLVIVWPFAPDRFVWGIWPMFGLLFALGVAAIGRWRAPGRALSSVRLAALAACVALIAGYGWYNVRAFRGHWWDTIQRDAAQRAKPLAEWVAANTLPTDTVSTDDDVLVHLYTGRYTVPNGTFTPREHVVPQTEEEGAAALREILGAYRVRFVLVGGLAPALAARRLAYETPPTLTFLGTLSKGAVFAPVAR